MRGIWARPATAWLIVLLAWQSAGPTAAAGKALSWKRAAEAVETLWRGDADRRSKSIVRASVVRRGDLERYGLSLDPDWATHSEDRPLVVLLYGFNSTPRKNSPLLTPLRKAGYSCATFAFPNDHGLDASASLLAKELRGLARRYPDRRVALVTHSMGGLVARACVEDPRLDPGNVARLIMIAPPNEGTQVAQLAFCADVWEHGLFRREGGCLARLKDSIVDGLAEAADDLRPGSAFLKRLNARPRNPDVQYSLLVGTGGCIREQEMDAARAALRKTTGRVPGLRTATRRLDRCLGELDEVIHGKGDGVVSVERARIPGIEDVVVLPFSHSGVTGEPRSAAVRKVHRAILVRLNRSSTSGVAPSGQPFQSP